MSRKPSGRPVNRDRAAALLLGDRTYKGKRCRKCGGVERYAKGCACVQCLRAYAVESRQLFKATKLRPLEDPPDFLALGKPLNHLDLGKPSPDAADDIDFLSVEENRHTSDTRRHTSTCASDPLDFIDEDDAGTLAHVFSSTSQNYRGSTTLETEDAPQSYRGCTTLEKGDFAETSVPEEESADGAMASLAHVDVCRRVSDVCQQSNPDPEPLCPDCGCNVEADHETIGGWLRRVSPWRCTICEWEDAEPAPPIDIDS